MINKFGILNGAIYFYSGIFQNYLAFIPAKNTLNIFVALLKLIHRDLMEFQKKIITKSDSSSVPYFVDYHVLPDTMDTV